MTERLTDESIAASTHTPAVTIRNRMVAAEAYEHGWLKHGWEA